jgi:hypothetical protein
MDLAADVFRDAVEDPAGAAALAAARLRKVLSIVRAVPSRSVAYER